MSETGFLAQQQRRSPTGFTLIVAAHLAALGGLALMKTPIFERPKAGPIIIHPVPVEPDPPPEEQMRPRTEQPSQLTAMPTPLPISDNGPVIDDPPVPPITYDPGPIVIADAGPPPIPPSPIRRAAELISRDLQPPYPPSEIRAQRGGRVQVQLTIGTDGRVAAVEMLSATSNAFWEATRTQALRRWRFRPATEDGRPVVATRVMTVTFRIEDAI